jgi:pimeloyl-ACP methyl ester carboxylesterase
MSEPIRGYVGGRSSQLHYRTAGTGPALVLLAPTPRSSNYYAALMPQLNGFRVIAVDTPGFGLSDGIPGVWSMCDLAGRIAEALDDIGLARYAVLGIHSGNKIGAALSAARPDRVSRFLFAGMTHSIVLDNETRNQAMRDFYAKADATEHPGRLAPRDARLAQRWRYVGTVIQEIWGSYDPALGDPEAEARRARVRRHVVDEVLGFESFDQLYAANFAFDLESTLRSLPVETIVMEMTVPAEEHLGRQSEILVSAMPRARAITLEGSDRMLVTSGAKVLADAIRHALSLEF